MAKEVRQNAIGVVPPTIGIKDPATRAVLDSLVNILDARSGHIDRSSPERFITASEFGGLVDRALVSAFGGIGASGAGTGGGTPTAADVGSAIDNLADSIRKSLIYQLLGEQFDLVDISQMRQRIGALVSRADTIAGRVSTLVIDMETGFTEEREAWTSADASITSALDAAVSRIGASEAAIISEQTTRATADSALTSSLSAAISRIGASEAAILAEQTTRATADTAITTSVTAAVSRVAAAEAAIVTEQTTRATADSALGTSLSAITARVGTAEAAIVSEQTARATADTALTTSLNAVTATLGTTQANVANEINVRASQDMVLASAINTLWSSIGGSTAVIQDGSLASATPSSSVATRWNQVVASVTDPNTGNVNSTSIKEDLNSYASNADGKFNSIYSVRAQVAVGGQTVVGGFGLAATAGAASGGGPTIDFGVRADKFLIAATSETPNAAAQIAQGSAIPFMVLTTSQVVNGAIYGPGVYIKKAVIGDATIGTAQIANAAITTAKIGDASITNAKIGNEISSSNYYPGSSGWRITKSGFAEFNDVVIRQSTLIASGFHSKTFEVSGINEDARFSPHFPVGSIIEGPTIYIDTGFTDYDVIGDQYSRGFYGRAEGANNSTIYPGGRSGNVYEYILDVSVAPSTIWSVVGTGSPGSRIFLKVKVSFRLIQVCSRIISRNFNWSLFRQR